MTYFSQFWAWFPCFDIVKLFEPVFAGAREYQRYAVYPTKISKVRYLSDAGGRNITFIFVQRGFVLIFDSVPFFRPYMSIKISFFQEYGVYGDFWTSRIEKFFSFSCDHLLSSFKSHSPPQHTLVIKSNSDRILAPKLLQFLDFRVSVGSLLWIRNIEWIPWFWK